MIFNCSLQKKGRYSNMSCTLQELQKTEYDILCRFADFCEEYSLNYVLDAGSLLGAVRHNGVIPWDDDVDVSMDIKSFRKFVRLLKKHPIPGLHLTWCETEPYSPFPFAKLRLDGTHMPEPQYKGLEEHDGVWIDIFAYFGKPKSSFMRKVQEILYNNYLLLTTKTRDFAKDGFKKKPDKNKFKFFLLKHLPKGAVGQLRRFALWLATSLGRDNSDEVFNTWWLTKRSYGIKRSHYEPVTKHVYGKRDFCIPQNYDARLSHLYGDYMTPVVMESHTQLDCIDL